jgi:hypothetical protein
MVDEGARERGDVSAMPAPTLAPAPALALAAAPVPEGPHAPREMQQLSRPL